MPSQYVMFKSVEIKTETVYVDLESMYIASYVDLAWEDIVPVFYCSFDSEVGLSIQLPVRSCAVIEGHGVEGSSSELNPVRSSRQENGG